MHSGIFRINPMMNETDSRKTGEESSPFGDFYDSRMCFLLSRKGAEQMEEQKKGQTKEVQKKSGRIGNSRMYDSGSKLIFGNAELCSQFLRNYVNLPILKNVKAEDIEDVSERYVPMFTEERNADTVKRVRISENNTLFFISLIEHKTKVDYNVGMQMLRYMVYIWEDYEKEMERKHKGISKTRDFRYPPVLPIVYYEGADGWTASRNFKERILFEQAFEPFTPNFFYKLIQLNEYSVKDLAEKNDELSFVMLMNKLQKIEDFHELELPDEYLENLTQNSTDETMDIVARVVETILRHIHISEEEIAGFMGQVKEWKMGELFEHFKDFDLPAARKAAKEEGWMEGKAEGLEEGRKQGRKEGRKEGKKEGIEKGKKEILIKSVETLMETFHVDLQKACEGIGTTVEEYRKAKNIE